MKQLILLSLSASLFLSPLSGAEKRPNVLFIFLDDFGWKDTSYMGSDFYETPHLDRLASEGMVFTNAYSCAANCAPARASLLSGQYTPRHQVFNVGTEPRGKAEYRKLEPIAGTSVLDPEITTWAEVLQEHGYRTATMGKWHLSDDPLPYGFDVNVGGSDRGGPPKGYYPPHGNVPGLKDVPDGEYVTTTLCKKGSEFIRMHREDPWFLYLTCFAVHTPIQAKKDLVAKYEGKAPGNLHQNVSMATMIQAVDDGVGLLLATLEELGLANNTAIFFFSDNGGYGPATDMEPLKGYKGTYYEGGIRVPCFVHWPGVVAPGQKSHEPIIGVDFFPTFCELASSALPEGQPVDGISLLPYLKGEVDELPQRSLFWHFPAYLQSYSIKNEQRDVLFRSRPCSIIRKGPWKLHEYFEDGALELYHLEDDIGEKTNLAQSQPELAQALRDELETWRKTIKAPVPRKLNPAYRPEVETQAMLEVRSSLDSSTR